MDIDIQSEQAECSSQLCSPYAQSLRRAQETRKEVLLDFMHLQASLDPEAIYNAYNVDAPGKKGNRFNYESFLLAYLWNKTDRPFPRLTSLTVHEAVCGLGVREDAKSMYTLFQFENLVELDVHGCCPPVNLIQFWNMHKLKKLCLDYTGISRLSPSVGRLKHLEILSLDSNVLSDLPTTLQFCQSLTTLSLNGNNFARIPGLVSKLKNLKELKHAGNPLIMYKQFVHAVPSKQSANTAHSPASLKSLCAAAVFIQHIDHWKWDNLSTKQCDVLNSLGPSLAICDRCSMPVSQEHIVTLSYHVPGQCFVPLHLKACSAKCQQKLVAHHIEKYITELERKMSDRIVLSISALAFSCDQNKSTEMMHLENVVDLDISGISMHSDFQSLMQIWDMQNVKNLNMSSTGASSLSPSIGRLKHLETLSLDSNALSDLPITLRFCQKLTLLSLKGNLFASIPGVVLMLKNLQELRLAGNPLMKYKKSVQVILQEEKSCIAYNPALLQSICIVAASANLLDYGKQVKHGQEQWKDHLASTVLCDRCNMVVSQEYDVEVSLVSYLGLNDIPFKLKTCSARCQQELASHYNQLNIAALYTKAFGKCTPSCAHQCSSDMLQGAEMIDSLILFENVVEFDFSGVSIPVDLQCQFQFWNMHNLKKMCMNSTGISSLSPSIGRLKNLEILSLDFNNLSDLPITLMFCHKLTALSLTNNQFSSFPGVILKLKNLTELHGGENPLDKERFPLAHRDSPTAAAATVDSVATLQSICARAVFMNHIDYWKHGSLGPSQRNKLDYIASNIAHCDRCGRMASQDHIMQIRCDTYFVKSDIPYRAPFSLHPCSMKCKQELVSYYTERNGHVSHVPNMKHRKKGCHIM